RKACTATGTAGSTRRRRRTVRRTGTATPSCRGARAATTSAGCGAGPRSGAGAPPPRSGPVRLPSLGRARSRRQRVLPRLVGRALALFDAAQRVLDRGPYRRVLRAEEDRLERLGAGAEDLADRRVVEVRVLERLEVRVRVDGRRRRQVVHLLEHR